MNLPTTTLEVVIERHPKRILTARIRQEGIMGTNLLPGHCTDLAKAMRISRQKIGMVMDVTGQRSKIRWVLPEGEHVEEKMGGVD